MSKAEAVHEGHKEEVNSLKLRINELESKIRDSDEAMAERERKIRKAEMTLESEKRTFHTEKSIAKKKFEEERKAVQARKRHTEFKSVIKQF